MLDVVYVKLNSISCEFSDLNVAPQGNERGNAVKVTWTSPACATAGQVVQ